MLNLWVIRYLLALLDLKDVQGQKIRFEHVKGHAGIQGNECADMQANAGALLSPLPERDWERLWKAKMTEADALRAVLLVIDKGIQVGYEGDGGKGVGEEDVLWADAGLPDNELLAVMDETEQPV